MNKWMDIISEEPSHEHSAEVMAAAREVLQQNKEQAPRRSWGWQQLGFGLAGLLSIAFVPYMWRRVLHEAQLVDATNALVPDLAVLEPDLFLQKDSDNNWELLQNLELMQDLDVIEHWSSQES